MTDTNNKRDDIQEQIDQMNLILDDIHETKVRIESHIMRLHDKQDLLTGDE